LATSRIKARDALPGLESFVRTQVPNLKAIMESDRLGNATSWFRFLPTTRDDTAALERRMDQAESSTYLEGIKFLRGLGPVTEVEGAAAQAAVARMSRAQSAADYRDAMKDYFNAMKQGITKGYDAAGLPVPPEIEALFETSSSTSNDDVKKRADEILRKYGAQ
jgi:hypothetical protein